MNCHKTSPFYMQLPVKDFQEFIVHDVVEYLKTVAWSLKM